MDPDYEASAIYRETFLEWFDDPTDRSTVQAYGELQYSMTLSYDHGPFIPQNWKVAQLRAVAKDLRYLKNYLREIGFVEPLDGPISGEDRRWVRYARRLAKRVGTIEEEIDRELATG